MRGREGHAGALLQVSRDAPAGDWGIVPGCGYDPLLSREKRLTIPLPPVPGPGTGGSDCRKTIFSAEFTGQNVGALIERPLKTEKMIGIFIVFSDSAKHIGKKISLHFRAINDRPYKSMEDNWLF